MKATVEEYDFHRRILARDDPVAFAQLADWLYAPLVQEVQQRAGHHADPVLVEEAVGEALLDYRDDPTPYDPERMSLLRYLVMAAYRDYQNAQAKERRVQAHQISLFDPDLPEAVSFSALEPDELIIGQEQATELWQCVLELFRDPTERRIALLMINGVRAPEPYAQIIGMGDMPLEEQRACISSVKYRIARRLRRSIARRLQRAEGDRS